MYKIQNNNDAVLYEESYTRSFNNTDYQEIVTKIGDGSYSTVSRLDLDGYETYSKVNGVETTYTVDMLGNTLTSITDGVTTKMEYDGLGNMLKLTRPKGGVYKYGYDTLGRKISETAPDGGITTFEYDDSNRLIKECAPMGSNSQKSEKKYTYDNNGNVKTESVKTNTVGSSAATYRTTNYNYDAKNNLIKVQNIDNSVNQCYTEYEYDGVGNILKQKAANGENVTSYTYDSQNRVTKMTDPMGMSESYVYDDAGNMIQKTDRNGTVLKYDYDAMNRITKEYAKVGTSEVIKSTYKYDGRNNLVEMNNGESAISMFYSERNLLNKTYLYQNSERYDIYCNYDKRGQVYDKYIYKYKSSGDEKLAGYKYTYDNNGNVTNIKYNGDGSSIYNDLEVYTYDSCDRVTKETRGSITTDYTYNMAGLVTGMTNKNGASVLSTYSNTYNYDGNVAKAVENGVTKNYTYDYMNLSLIHI